MTIGQTIQNFRKEKGYTQKQLAEKCGMATGTIQQYELNKREPRQEQLRKIADALEVELWEIVELDQMDSETRIQQIKKMVAQLTPEGLEEFNKMLTESLNENQGSSQKVREEAARKAPKFMGSDNRIYTDPNLQKLYEVAIEKAVRHEKLTEEEEQVIIGIPGQLRQKSDSYEDSYSFASSEEELNRILKQCQKQGEELLLNDYRKLSEIGQLEARKRVSELTEIHRYTKPGKPPQD